MEIWTTSQQPSIWCDFAVTTVDDKILVMGGYHGRGVTNMTEIFNEATNEWASYTPLKEPRGAFASVTLNHYAINYFNLIKND